MEINEYKNFYSFLDEIEDHLFKEDSHEVLKDAVELGIDFAENASRMKKQIQNIYRGILKEKAEAEKLAYKEQNVNEFKFSNLLPIEEVKKRIENIGNKNTKFALAARNLNDKDEDSIRQIYEEFYQLGAFENDDE